MSLKSSKKPSDPDRSLKESLKSKAWSELEGERSFATGEKALAEAAHWLR